MKYFFKLIAIALLMIACADGGGDTVLLGPGDGATGIAGSTSRFIIRGSYLYIATDTKLKVMDLSAGNEAVQVASLPSFGDLETIFSFGNYLFLGAQSGVYVYDIQDPAAPEYLVRYQHQTACDPVIATEGFAYLTIRDGVDCRGASVNQLITLDISEIENPVAVDTVEMLRPRGLTIYEGSLYVGEGIYGLKKFDLSIPYRPQLDTFYSNVPTNDLIALESHLIITESNGVSQYTVKNDSLNQLSVIQ